MLYNMNRHNRIYIEISLDATLHTLYVYIAAIERHTYHYHCRKYTQAMLSAPGREY